MPDYTNSKPAGNRSVAADGTVTQQASDYPIDADASKWGRRAPLITPEQLVDRYLVGIPLKFREPITRKWVDITPDMLKDYIQLAVGTAENEVGMVVMPTQFHVKLPFHKQDFEQFGYWRLGRKPVTSIEQLDVQLADGGSVFSFPTTWIETSALIRGQLNIIPLALQQLNAGTGIVGGSLGAGGGTAVFFNSLWNRAWVGQLMGCVFTAGWKNGQLPDIVNDYIGTLAAMRVLSMVAATFRVTSTSLGMDGMSQSISGPGPNVYQLRMTELKAERDLSVKKLKKLLNLKLFSGSVV